jgi:hypothetical protein
MDVGAASLASLFDKGRVADKPQALPLNARVKGNGVLQLVAFAHAFPNVFGFFRGWRRIDAEPFWLLSKTDCSISVSTAIWAILAVALTASQGYTHDHHKRFCVLCQSL